MPGEASGSLAVLVLSCLKPSAFSLWDDALVLRWPFLVVKNGHVSTVLSAFTCRAELLGSSPAHLLLNPRSNRGIPEVVEEELRDNGKSFVKHPCECFSRLLGISVEAIVFGTEAFGRALGQMWFGFQSYFL